MNPEKLGRFLIVSIVLLLFSCVSTMRVTMNTFRPADIMLPKDIRTIVLVDRTDFKNQAVNIIEGVLTGELPMEDRAAVQEGLAGMRNLLQTNDRFHVIVDPNRYKGNSLTSVFPAPLSWSTIGSICGAHDAQAVVAIELFDSDFIVTDEKKRVKKKIRKGEATVEREVDEYFARGVMNMKLGIRLYDNIRREVVDDELFSRTQTWKSRADSRDDAIEKLIRKGDATRVLCGRICENYIRKIAPLPIRITRKFYRKSKKAPAIEQGTRYADVNKWDEAIATWKKGLDGTPEKEAGYLAYNIAIGYEVTGDYDRALKWAQDAYTEYGNNLAQSYVSMLRSRKESERRLDEQMDGGE
ncbi:MAG: hypothetical protein JW863_07045 [Chitinispirillaceae bacterium]|nr:hypothetical protein [Chitinispirillaceae bacterium]